MASDSGVVRCAICEMRPVLRRRTACPATHRCSSSTWSWAAARPAGTACRSRPAAAGSTSGPAAAGRACRPARSGMCRGRCARSMASWLAGKVAQLRGLEGRGCGGLCRAGRQSTAAHSSTRQSSRRIMVISGGQQRPVNVEGGHEQARVAGEVRGRAGAVAAHAARVRACRHWPASGVRCSVSTAHLSSPRVAIQLLLRLRR